MQRIFNSEKKTDGFEVWGLGLTEKTTLPPRKLIVYFANILSRSFSLLYVLYVWKVLSSAVVNFPLFVATFSHSVQCESKKVAA